MAITIPVTEATSNTLITTIGVPSPVLGEAVEPRYVKCVPVVDISISAPVLSVIGVVTDVSGTVDV
jgi:hypothetical protein